MDNVLEELPDAKETALIWGLVGLLGVVYYGYQLGVCLRFASEKFNEYIDSNRRFRRAYYSLHEYGVNVNLSTDVKGEPCEDQA